MRRARAAVSQRGTGVSDEKSQSDSTQIGIALGRVAAISATEARLA